MPAGVRPPGAASGRPIASRAASSRRAIPAEPSDGRTVREPGSFRDPAGFVFRRDGVLLRQVNRGYAGTWSRLLGSGLHEELVADGLLVPHRQVPVARAGSPAEAHAVIRPEPVDFVSYPYEWCFGQLRDAALLTLDIQVRALARGLRLKDASAFNVQFHRGRPVLIDTLSFEPHADGEPWPAYRQFCEHFLAPLALMAGRDPRLGALSRVWIDGVPLPLASRLLPWRTRLRPALLFHIHLHAKAQRRAAGSADRPPGPAPRVGARGLAGVLASLRTGVERLEWEPSGTPWAGYDGTGSYAGEDLDEKRRLVAGMLERLRPGRVWDLGANDGRFSREAAALGARTVAFDMDPAAVERNYRRVRKTGERNLLPLRTDLVNPSPGLGWEHRERASLVGRGPADCVLALALVHHLAIGDNLPFERIAPFLASIGRTLIIEFVPRDDARVVAMLAARRQERPDYAEARFRAEFGRWFEIEEAVPVGSSGRVLYRMARRSGAPAAEPSGDAS